MTINDVKLRQDLSRVFSAKVICSSKKLAGEGSPFLLTFVIKI